VRSLVDKCRSEIIFKESKLRKKPRRCGRTDIAVGVWWNKGWIFLCEKCWGVLSKSGVVWDYEVESQ